MDANDATVVAVDTSELINFLCIDTMDLIDFHSHTFAVTDYAAEKSRTTTPTSGGALMPRSSRAFGGKGGAMPVP